MSSDRTPPLVKGRTPVLVNGEREPSQSYKVTPHLVERGREHD